MLGLNILDPILLGSAARRYWPVRRHEMPDIQQGGEQQGSQKGGQQGGQKGGQQGGEQQGSGQKSGGKH
jgi:hypothetical protein